MTDFWALNDSISFERLWCQGVVSDGLVIGVTVLSEVTQDGLLLFSTVRDVKQGEIY